MSVLPSLEQLFIEFHVFGCRVFQSQSIGLRVKTHAQFPNGSTQMAASIRSKAFNCDLAVGDSNLQLADIGNIEYVPPCSIIMVEGNDDRVQRPCVVVAEGVHYQNLISVSGKNTDDTYI